jgi:pSer/pThr/pTyr-binding forkhead associated (FHA) protein
MNDPRLNSVHLDCSRREDFRRARDALLGARGQRTLSGEKDPAQARIVSPAPSAGGGQESAVAADHWLLDRESVYPLRTGVNTIGRLADNDVIIPGPYVSRRHCAILVHAGDGCELHDIASKNGTFVNGTRLSGPTPLHPGDEIRMCDRRFVFMSRDNSGQGQGQESTRRQ